MSQTSRNLLIWCIVFVSIFTGVSFLTDQNEKKSVNAVTYSQFIESINTGSIASIVVQGPNISGKTKQGKDFSTYVPFHNPSMLQDMVSRGIDVVVKPMESEFSFWAMIIPWIPLLVLVGLVVYSMRQMHASGNKAIGFGRSSAQVIEGKTVTTKFEDVAGVDEAKQELCEVVDFLKNAQKFQKLGGKIPKGILLVGQPGTGKTLLAKAIAGEAGVPFFSIAGSDFVEVFVGVGASRVRDLFGQAKKNSPSIIFIDEIDAVGRRRGSGYGGGNDEREQTLNQMLVEMDGFDASNTVIVIAATNRADVLDNALLRPGRFDRRVVVPLPDLLGREKILDVHMAKVPIDTDVKKNVIARGTPGFSGADLANLVNEAALFAARHGKATVSMKDFEYAKDKVLMGSERRSMVIRDEQKKLTAFHEAGHAVVSLYTQGSDPIHKATIIPRGDALGMVVSLPEDDHTSLTYETLISQIMMAMGGKVAEEMIFGKNQVTTGASSDIKAATHLARRMVTEWGMSERLGFQYCDFINSSYGIKDISDSTSRVVDEEVAALLTSCFEKTKALLVKHQDALYALANALLMRETLSGDEVRLVCEGHELPPLTDFADEARAKPADDATKAGKDGRGGESSEVKRRGRPKKDATTFDAEPL
ncbi:MAG: ATP-dependent zinc metalloprotease FtsH [Holosporales bacterium]|nr:ATP-dependent zinc metalloprotease FtsH [Holosporales bacterium]